MKIVLASGSKIRRDILDMIGLKYDVVVSDIDEISNKKSPSKYVEELSLTKALCVSQKVSDCIIISADTIMYCDGKRYEKPKSRDEAFNNLMELSGKKSYCYTGVTIFDLYQNKNITFHSKIGVYFRDVSEEEAKWYVEGEENIFNCCGYVPRGKASLFIDKVVGDYYTLFGLSPNTLFNKLYELGYSINDFEWINNK